MSLCVGGESERGSHPPAQRGSHPPAQRGSHPPAQSVETQEMSLLQSLGNTLSFPGTLSRMALKH